MQYLLENFQIFPLPARHCFDIDIYVTQQKGIPIIKTTITTNFDTYKDKLNMSHR